MNESQETLSPMMKQYEQMKQEYPEALLMFRLGDFYELFGEDAKLGASILGITLTARSVGEGRAVKIPMCGVPFHSADTYISRLIKAGHKVAIVEQMEDPKKGKGMVRRELVRVVTPGTIMESDMLEAKHNNFLAALTEHEGAYGAAFADLSTGEFMITEFVGPAAIDDLEMEVARYRPREILIPDFIPAELLDQLRLVHEAFQTKRPGHVFDVDAGRAALLEYFKLASLEGLGCDDFSAALGAAGAILSYIKETRRAANIHLQALRSYTTHSSMVLDSSTLRNLELIQNNTEHTVTNTLLEVLDHTLTSMGGRRLQRWLLNPLIHLEMIHRRQSAVAELLENHRWRQRLFEPLKAVCDLERLAGRISSGLVQPRELKSLQSSLEQIEPIRQILREAKSPFLTELISDLPDLQEIMGLLNRALVDEPPRHAKEGGVFRGGYHPEVDELRGLLHANQGFLLELQNRERERTGIASLKVEYNSVFGYYLEVTKANSKLVPADYQRKQTLVNAERYITPELKGYEEKIVGANDRLYQLEADLFEALRKTISGQIAKIVRAAGLIADLDCVMSLAEAAARYRYVRPQIDEGDALSIHEGRHPVVERLTREKFVPNDVLLDSVAQQIIILTGPNMAGKSTYLRQTALIVIMAQMGGYVPATTARLGIIDRVFTRVGAGDNLAAGQSTFMVEMTETANILRQATPRSLIILDEVGRGTSTFDGVSIAWSVVEHLHDTVRAKTLFATHYYELTEVALTKERVKNFSIVVREWNNKIIFLRKIVSGSTDRSYGIQVASLAGLPHLVIDRAKEVLANLEKANYTESGKSRLSLHGQEVSEAQTHLFESAAPEHEVVQSLRALDLNRLTPLEALAKLAELQERST
jgi:DNA mismatch repair protein MutS